MTEEYGEFGDYGGESPQDLSDEEPAEVDTAGLPETGDPQVDAVLSPLAGLSRQPVAEHVARFEQVHRGLQDALAQVETAESGD